MTANPPVIKPIRLNSASHQLQKASVLRRSHLAGNRIGPPRSLAADSSACARSICCGRRGIARLRDDAGKQKYKSIGIVTAEFGFDQAKAVAAEWFKLQESGVKTTEVRSVADACKAYVKSLTLTNGTAGGHDAELRLRRTVYQSDLGKKSLSSVRITHVRSWRDGLKTQGGKLKPHAHVA